MFRNAAIVSCLFFSFTCGAHADQVSDALNIRNEKNPVAALLKEEFGCDLINPPSGMSDLTGNVGPGVAGNITEPTTLKDGQTLDLVKSAKLCRVTDFKPTLKPDAQNEFKDGSLYIEWTDSLSASLKLTLGSWLKLVDFDATDLQTIGIAISTGTFEYDQKQLRKALRDIKANDPDGDCDTLKSPRAQQVIRTCVGHLTISLISKKALSLNAFDLKFASLAVGLKASWLREVKGTGQDCDVAGAAAPGTGGGAAAPAAAVDKALKNGVTATLNFGEDGSVKIVPTGKLEISYPPPVAEKAEVGKPSDDQIKKVGATTQSVTPKNEQPKAQDKICVKNVLYRTSDARILGVLLTSPKITASNIKAISAAKK